MTREEARAQLDAWGYEWDADGAYDDTFWVKTPEGVHLVNVTRELEKIRPNRFGTAPAMRTENTWSSGNFKYRVAPGVDPKRDNVDCLVDYADDKGRKHWKKYVTVKDPKTGRVLREGPAPFGSKSERLEYERLTGMRHRDKDAGKYDLDKRRRLRPKE